MTLDALPARKTVWLGAWFGVACLFSGLAFIVIPALGALIEENIPWFYHSSFKNVTFKLRTLEVVCWTQEFEKYRAGGIRIWDYHLSDDKGNVSSVTPMRSRTLENPPGFNTGEPPRLGESVPLGFNKTSFCITLPSWAKSDTTLTVYGTIGYYGPDIFGNPWWTTYVKVPPIHFPPNAA